MSRQWRAPLLIAVFGLLLLVLALYKAPESGWGMVWVAVVFLIVGPLLTALESRRPPRPFKQRRVINTAFAVGGLATVYALPDLINGSGFSWDSWNLRLLILLMLGLICWFGTRPEGPSSRNAGQENH